MDCGDHLVDYSRFTLYQTGPDALVLGLGRRRLVIVGLGMDAEQAFHDLLWGPHPRLAGVDMDGAKDGIQGTALEAAVGE
jgi:hypothetical protein